MAGVIRMTRAEYKAQGWSLLEYDDDILDTLDKFKEQLRRYNLTLEMTDEECDGFEPIRIVKLSG